MHRLEKMGEMQNMLSEVITYSPDDCKALKSCPPLANAFGYRCREQPTLRFTPLSHTVNI